MDLLAEVGAVDVGAIFGHCGLERFERILKITAIL
jgi:hypothetical protein